LSFQHQTWYTYLCDSHSACIDPKVRGQGHMAMKTIMVTWLLVKCAAATLCCW